jgi:hypothetical protein
MIIRIIKYINFIWRYPDTGNESEKGLNINAKSYIQLKNKTRISIL